MECKLKNITAHYEIFGEGRPIVMLHPWAADHRVMLSVFEPIFKHRAGWKRIYLDLPGMGKTPGQDWITHEDQVLEIILEFVDTVVGGERFVVVGLSYGGYLARGLVYHRARWLDGLLLAAPMIVADAAKRTLPPHVTLVRDEGLIAELESDEVEFFEKSVVVQSRAFVSWLRATTPPPEELPNEEFLSKLRENYAFSFDVDALPEPFDKPTLIILGRQDSVVGYRDAWNIVENYPRATFAVLDRAGHFLGIEQADLFNVLVNEWLDRVEESNSSSKAA
jgi:pimeloyl-ACP methyl ester carboxylesterase